MKTKVVIFGASGRGKEILYRLDESKYEVLAFVDNNSAMQGKVLYGGGVINPSLLATMDFDYVLISIPEYEEEIRKQLFSIGVPNEKIVVYNPIQPVDHLDIRIAHLRDCLDRLKELDIPGNCAELGVYRGDFSKFINRYMPDRKLYLFDTFEGFGEQKLAEVEKNISNFDVFNETSVKIVMDKMIHPEQCIVKKGFFPKTAEGLEDEFCFVSLDADLYEPIYEGLKYFYPRMAKGGYILVHDYGTEAWPGAKIAVDQYCKEQKIQIFPLLDNCLSCVIVKS